MFIDKIKQYSELVDKKLAELFMSDGVVPEHLNQVMSYSVMAGGKRLRPALVLATCQMLGGMVDEAIPYACAIELIHTYSLIHDDLPCLDNDDMRRGRPTSHKMFDEPRALLAGDALLSYAFEIMLNESFKHSDTRHIAAAVEIAKAAGIHGMVAGQWQDVLSEGKEISKQELEYIHRHKTADMICGAIRAGAAIGGATNEQLEMLTNYGYKIGLTFQISDDILDVIGDSGKLGKNTGSDAAINKVTYVSMYGLNEAMRIEKEITKEACDIISFFKESEFFVELANYIIERDN